MPGYAASCHVASTDPTGSKPFCCWCHYQSLDGPAGGFTSIVLCFVVCACNDNN